jgi:hypothetical protein
MKTIEKIAKATTQRGTVINITCTSERGFEMRKEVSFCDGDNVEINKGFETKKDNVNLIFADKNLNGHITTNRPSPTMPVFFGYFMANDNKTVLPLDKEVYETIENCKKEAISEAETDESYTAQQLKKAIARKEEEEYYKNKKAVENMMTLNGKTY